MQTTQPNQPRRFKQQGFTLIELLIVVAIIGILAAVGVPQYGNYLDRSAISSCTAELSNFRSVAGAEAAFADGDPAIVEAFEFQACFDDADQGAITSNADLAVALVGDGSQTFVYSSRGDQIFVSNGQIGTDGSANTPTNPQ